MHPRCCRYFLVSALVVQSIAILWLIKDLTYLSSDSIRFSQPDLMDQPHPLTIRDLQVFEDTNPPTQATSSATKEALAPSFDTLSTQIGDRAREYWHGKEILMEKNGREPRELSDFEAAGNNIMITIRTTRKFHQKRLPYMYETWLNVVNGSNVFLVTDATDKEYQEKSKKLGVHYEIISCGTNYSRWSLCCKSGEEMALMHKPENKQYDWFCHLDDDIYIVMKNLIKLFSKYDGKKEPIYMGRPGSFWKKPRSLSNKQSFIKDKNRKFHFAVGGMYCLSRAMLNKVKPWIGNGKLMGDTCNKFLEPEDVTVGATVELLANERLSRTKLFHPHGLILGKHVNPRTLKHQIGFAYGCGQLCAYKGYKNNAVKVPHARFRFKDDPSRFKSIHCHLFPEASLCR